MKALDYLLKKEWSMGNGQCPDCCGLSPKWYGNPLNLDPNGIGHKPGCPLAAVLVELGGKPIMLGEFKSDVEYENCISSMGTLGSQVKGSNPEAKKAWEDHCKKMAQALESDMLEIWTRE